MNKISGFYRMFIKHENKEYSYVGLSKNIHQRIKKHQQKIKSFYQLTNFEKVFFPRLYLQIANPDELHIPAIDAFYWKAAFFLYFRNKKPENFRWEILKEKEINVLTDQFEEMKFIENFNSEKLGFNGPFAKAFQIQNMLNYEINENKRTVLKNLFDLQEKKNSLLVKELENTKENSYVNNFMPWLGLQMGVKKWQDIYWQACEIIFRGGDIEEDNSFLKMVRTRVPQVQNDMKKYIFDAVKSLKKQNWKMDQSEKKYLNHVIKVLNSRLLWLKND